MSNSSIQVAPTDLAEARDEGRRQALAIAALGVALLSFLNLLFGVEKAILAIVLAWTAASGSRSKLVRRRSFIAIGLAVLQLAITVVAVVLLHEEFLQLYHLIAKLA